MAGLFLLIHQKYIQKVGEKMIFYDFEVFAYDWLVVLIDLNAKEETVIINDPKKLSRFYEKHKGTIWAGYNSRHYDQFILKGILCGFNPKKVNDWIILDDIKAKGAYVKKLSDLDYDLPIVNRAISEYFVHGKPPEETIWACDSLRDFQKVVKVSSKYECALYSPVITMEKIRDAKGRSKSVKRFSGGEVQTDKTFRVFASKDHSKGGLFKVSGKVVNGRKKNPEKFGNTPEHCFIINDDVSSLPVPAELDRQYYIQLAWKRLKDYGVDREGGGSEPCNFFGDMYRQRTNNALKNSKGGKD